MVEGGAGGEKEFQKNALPTLNFIFQAHSNKSNLLIFQFLMLLPCPTFWIFFPQGLEWADCASHKDF